MLKEIPGKQAFIEKSSVQYAVHPSDTRIPCTKGLSCEIANGAIE